MEISTLATLSTIHIHPKTANILQSHPDKSPIPVYPNQYGYFLYISNIDQETWDTIADAMPDILHCIHFVTNQNNNIEWIKFDRDKEPEPNLPNYALEWDNYTSVTKTTRISKRDYYLDIATAISKRSTCLRRHYGCVIVNNDEIVATGYNGSARNTANCCDKFSVCPRSHMAHNSGDYSDCPAVHAEQNALLSAARNELSNATLYLNGEEYDKSGNLIPIQDIEPCPICQRMIQNAGIKTIVTPNKNIILRLS